MTEQNFPKMFYAASVLSEPLVVSNGSQLQTGYLFQDALYQSDNLIVINANAEQLRILNLKKDAKKKTDESEIKFHAKASQIIKTSFEKFQLNCAFMKLDDYGVLVVPAYMTNVGFKKGINFNLINVIESVAKNVNIQVMIRLFGDKNLYKKSPRTFGTTKRSYRIISNNLSEEISYQDSFDFEIVLYDILNENFGFVLKFDETLANEFGDVIFMVHPNFAELSLDDNKKNQQFIKANKDLTDYQLDEKHTRDIYPKLYATDFSYYTEKLYRYFKK